ncbi:MAG: hypothetical protein LBP75_01825 [Planctomycetota bacterium]|jgi:hypothetical protein|nr:hypothetical protein [Planctomycetota bacterium]
MNFDIDDIHRIRVELAEERAKMTPDERRADREKSIEYIMTTFGIRRDQIIDPQKLTRTNFAEFVIPPQRLEERELRVES